MCPEPLAPHAPAFLGPWCAMVAGWACSTCSALQPSYKPRAPHSSGCLPCLLPRRCAALRGIRDDIEKEHAFLGLCALLRINPQARVCEGRLPAPLQPGGHIDASFLLAAS